GLVRAGEPGLALTNIVLPSEDGAEAYVFDGVGRHLRTHETLTGALRQQFAYDGNGRLTAVTDGDGSPTTIERDGTGRGTASAGPHSQRPSLTTDANGFLSAIADPAGQSTRPAARADGLLDSLTNARGGQSVFTWDDSGRIVRDQDAAGHVITLQRTEADTGHSVAVTAQG